MLKIGGVYRTAQDQDSSKPIVDGFPNYFYETNADKEAPNFKTIFYSQSGIHFVRSVKGPENIFRIPVIILFSSAHKYGTSDTPWAGDEYDIKNGLVEYHGDAKPGNPTGRGNQRLIEEFNRITAPDQKERATPIVFFERPKKGQVIFHGLGVLTDYQPIKEIDQKTKQPFDNIIFHFKLLTLPNDLFDWKWIAARADDRRTLEEADKLAPESWKNWLGDKTLKPVKLTSKPEMSYSLRVKGAENRILFGAPGTGKSHRIDEIIKACEVKSEYFRTTFHPDTDYSSFVGGFKPLFDEKIGKLTYQFIPQVFTEAYCYAWNHPFEMVFLVIEEINRGDCAQAFGDIFQLLDRDEEGNSKYKVRADADLRRRLAADLSTAPKEDTPQEVRLGNEMMLPSNLTILATMNTSDQSLYAMDSAFKRRWEWEYVPLEINENERWIETQPGRQYDWGKFVEAVNEKIFNVTQSEDKQLGYYFIGPEKKVISAKEFVSKVLSYLWMDVFKDYPQEKDSPFCFNTTTNGSVKENDFVTYRRFYMQKGEVNVSYVEGLLEKLGLKPTSPAEENPSSEAAN